MAIAAITSCTQTADPALMVQAGLLAERAVEAGLSAEPWVKTSLSPGSRVVEEYLRAAGLLPALERTGFHIVGFGCMTCIGNSGPLHPAMERLAEHRAIEPVAVPSGNRNFAGRVNPRTALSSLASAPLVVAYALAGSILHDFDHDPLGSTRFPWSPGSTLRPPATASDRPGGHRPGPRHPGPGEGAAAPRRRCDHRPHLPRGPDPADSAAGHWPAERHVARRDRNQYSTRRSNHEVMLRGAFTNPAVTNLLPGTQSGAGAHAYTADRARVLPVYDAAPTYREAGDDLVGMGVLPLEFPEGDSAAAHAFTGEEDLTFEGLGQLRVGTNRVILRLQGNDGRSTTAELRLRILSRQQLDHLRHGGILPYVVRRSLQGP
ncbi:aconitase family protein [Streptomyces sp. NPDC021212]|uniref:aconitase family protein n=1 Tax=Streptomyces sp. NPDC021212 TaxID=3365118 RepID=UPI00378A98C7